MRISDWSSAVCSSDLQRRQLLCEVAVRAFERSTRDSAGRAGIGIPQAHGAGLDADLVGIAVDGAEAIGVGHVRDRDLVEIPRGARAVDAAQDAFLGHLDADDVAGRHTVLFDTRTIVAVELGDRKSTRLNSRHYCASRMPSFA